MRVGCILWFTKYLLLFIIIYLINEIHMHERVYIPIIEQLKQPNYNSKATFESYCALFKPTQPIASDKLSTQLSLVEISPRASTKSSTEFYTIKNNRKLSQKILSKNLKFVSNKNGNLLNRNMDEKMREVIITNRTRIYIDMDTVLIRYLQNKDDVDNRKALIDESVTEEYLDIGDKFEDSVQLNQNQSDVPDNQIDQPLDNCENLLIKVEETPTEKFLEKCENIKKLSDDQLDLEMRTMFNVNTLIFHWPNQSNNGPQLNTRTRCRRSKRAQSFYWPKRVLKSKKFNKKIVRKNASTVFTKTTTTTTTSTTTATTTTTTTAATTTSTTTTTAAQTTTPTKADLTTSSVTPTKADLTSSVTPTNTITLNTTTSQENNTTPKETTIGKSFNESTLCCGTAHCPICRNEFLYRFKLNIPTQRKFSFLKHS